VTVLTPSAGGIAPAAGTAADSHRLRDLLVAGFAALAAVVVLYAVFIDQGALLAPLLGKASFNANYLHEFAHDGRHLLSGPCH
jgi:hypothetical protein